jgi:hypothetical protein
MKHVPKQEWMGCAVATAAMLADLTYEEVAARQLTTDIAGTRWPKEFCALLKCVTETEWKATATWFRPRVFSSFSFPQWPVAVFLQDAPFRPRTGHWIVVKRDVVHDPGERSAYALTRYLRRDWHIGCLAQPVRPLQFARYQLRRRMDAIQHVLEREGLGRT